VATHNTLLTGSLIDAAFLAPRQAMPRPTNRFAAAQEKAMAQRLQQLETALGEHTDNTPATVIALPAGKAPSAKRGHGISRTLIACLLSAALGASAMWLAMQDQTATSATQRQPITLPVAATAIVSPVEQAQPESVPSAANSIPDEKQIGDLLETWRQAWQGHDLPAYLAAYGSGFTPADGGSRDAWVAARSKKLAGNAAIEVQLHNVVIERLEQDRFKVSFEQDYASGSYREVGRGKTLHVAREGDGWKIVREQQTR
jgi:ketosteroid isomerase-like protein